MSFGDIKIQHLGDNMYGEMTHPMLTVSDVERLAKAGIAIRFEDIKNLMVPDHAAVGVEPARTLLADALWERWDRAEENKRRLNRYDPFGDREAGLTTMGDNGNHLRSKPFELYAVRAANNIHVVVTLPAQEPVIIKDDIRLYPSDALMASLFLLIETNGAK